jgi:hypothetical protein
VPKVAAVSGAVAAAAVLAVVLTRSGDGAGGGGTGGGGRGEVFLQAAAATGQDPYTPSTARDTAVTPSPAGSTAPGTGQQQPVTATRSVAGSAPGLYGGTESVASCDVERQAGYLGADAAKNRAFASALGIGPGTVPGYLRSLTAVQLRWDTRVTNHGYRDGSPTAYQAVLQSGTAVLVDGHGVPRVRCACGNPLTPPVAQRTVPRTTGSAWPGFRPANVVVVAPSVTIVNHFVVKDEKHGGWFDRKRADHGTGDRKTAPPPPITFPTLPPPSAPAPAPTPPSAPGTTVPGTPTPSGPTPPTPTPTPSGPTPPTPTPTPSGSTPAPSASVPTPSGSGPAPSSVAPSEPSSEPHPPATTASGPGPAESSALRSPASASAATPSTVASSPAPSPPGPASVPPPSAY